MRLQRPELIRDLTVAVAATLVLFVAGCSNQNLVIGATVTPTATATNTPTPTPTATPIDLTSAAAYADPGPYPVGYTTLELSDRLVAVWYPAVPGSEQGAAKLTYDQRDPLPDELRNLYPTTVDLTYTVDCYPGLPASTSGPFPVILFSHGYGGWRLVNSSVMSGVASWGFVVAAPDHLERGLAAVAGFPPDSSRPDNEVLLDALAALASENARAGGPLEGRVDTEHVGAVGHSAGGAAVLSMLNDPHIDAVVGYAAAGGPPPNPQHKPAMLLVAADDLILNAVKSQKFYDALVSPKRFVVFANTGHNTFSDTCAVIYEGNDIVQVAIDAGFPIPAVLLNLGRNGCESTRVNPRVAWRAIQHLTVAHLREAFGIDAPPVGLGDGVVNAFPGVSLTYRHD